MPVMICDRCETMKNGVYWIQFHNPNGVFVTGGNMDIHSGKMCRACRNQYRGLIHIPLWYNGGCQLEKFEALINEFWFAEHQTAYLNQENPSIDGIPNHIVLPPVIEYYGVRVSFEHDGFS